MLAVLCVSTLLFLGFVAGSDDAVPYQWLRWNAVNAAADAPEPRTNFAMGYDFRRKKIYIFGGLSANGTALADTWIFDIFSRTWLRPLSSQPNPPARHGMLAAMDQPLNQDRDALVISHGLGANGQELQDTWSFDLNFEIWAQITTITGDIPSGRYDIASAVDATNGYSPLQHIFMYGGRRGKDKFQDSTYILTLGGRAKTQAYDLLTAKWSKVSITSSSSPTGRSGMAAAGLSKQRMVMYGGCASAKGGYNRCPSNEAWMLSLDVSTLPTSTDASQRNEVKGSWEKLPSCPGPRNQLAMVRNPDPGAVDNVIIFGGSGGFLFGDGRAGQVSSYDTSKSEWSLLVPLQGNETSTEYPAPLMGSRMVATAESTLVVPQRNNASMTTSIGLDIMLFFGAKKDKTLNSDIWILRLNAPRSNSSTGTTSQQVLSGIIAPGEGSQCQSIPNWVLTHAIAMFVVALAFMPSGLAFARYVRAYKNSKSPPTNESRRPRRPLDGIEPSRRTIEYELKDNSRTSITEEDTPTPSWVYIHGILQMLSILISIGGLVLIVLAIGDDKHFATSHGVIGIMLYPLFLLQIVFAFIRTPLATTLHQYFGRISIGLAIIATITGAALVETKGWTVSTAVLVAFWACLIMMGEWFMWRRKLGWHRVRRWVDEKKTKNREGDSSNVGIDKDVGVAKEESRTDSESTHSTILSNEMNSETGMYKMNAFRSDSAGPVITNSHGDRMDYTNMPRVRVFDEGNMMMSPSSMESSDSSDEDKRVTLYVVNA